MPHRLNSVLNVPADKLDALGVFNSFVDVDSLLYVDPGLLSKTQIPELNESRKKFRDHFVKILTLIQHSKASNDRFWREAHKLLQFKEFKYVALGYSVGNKTGNAIGPKLAVNLLNTAKEIIDAGISDPVLFELIGLLEEGIGADRISDMVVSIIKHDLIAYTERVCVDLGIPTRKFGRVSLPVNPHSKEAIVFVPKDILKELPIAFSWDDIDRVCTENEEIRNSMNSQIGKSWKYATTRLHKRDLKKALLREPEALKDLISQYKKKPRIPYDFVNDPNGEIVWAELSEKAVEAYPLNFKQYSKVTPENIIEVVKLICNQFKKLIEFNGWSEFLYDNGGKLRHERFAQKLFYGIADQYCLFNNFNLSREPNAGSGALDFKISKGYKTVVSIEIKYSSNTNLLNGYTKQLPTYNNAESAELSVYLVLQTTATNASVQRLQKTKAELDLKTEKCPEIIIIDARPRPSASNL